MIHDKTLSGKVAAVTGGANGLGEAIATRMSEEGAAVAVLDRDKEGGERVAEKLAPGSRETRPPATAVPAAVPLLTARRKGYRYDITYLKEPGEPQGVRLAVVVDGP